MVSIQGFKGMAASSAEPHNGFIEGHGNGVAYTAMAKRTRMKIAIGINIDVSVSCSHAPKLTLMITGK